VQTFLATLQSGSIVAAAGLSGGCAAGASPAVNADVFDLGHSRWSPAGTLEIARALTTATTLPDGKILVAGGSAASGVVQSSAEFFDPATGGWNVIGALHAPR